MAKNTGNNHRHGSVDNRSQTHNPKTNNWVKRDTTTGRFIDQKTSSNEPFKGVRKERYKLYPLHHRYKKSTYYLLSKFLITFPPL